jgi:transitional endoplasmic reticulum ATPase
MKTLYSREVPIPCLYVKQAQYVFNLTAIFEKARAMSPCLLIFEDIDTIVTPMTRAYFFNEVDGLENNDGLMMLGSTNYLERLDPGLTKRPSRFDRKYLFPIPNFEERVLYCEFWRRKLEKNKKIDFPGFLCREMARITENFSFAYLQEAFVATMLVLTGDEGHKSDKAREYQPSPEDFPIWREFYRQVSTLKRDMDFEGRVDFDEFAGGMADEPGLQADVREDVLVAREAREAVGARGDAVLPPYLPEASYQAPEFSFDAMPRGIVVTLTRDGGKE